ncbi:tRNA-specific adenosine deaminase subunit tad3, partial [Coemansia sp. RSA 2599]
MINIERILTTEELQTLETEQVYTATIEATQTSEILQFIAKTLPKLEGLEHVKRVKRQQPSGRLSVILCQGSKLDEQKLVEVFQKEDRWSTLVIDKAEVPRTPPYTKQQYEEWKTLWPVSFRPLEKLRKQRLPDEETGYVEG